MIRCLTVLFVVMVSEAIAEMKKVADLDYVGNGNPRQMLDLYLPEKTDGPVPVVIWIHGGAWRQGSKRSAGRVLRVAEGKYAVVSVGYRLTQEAQWPAQIHDCKAALRFVRANAKKYGLDSDRIAVWGSSAGGHLVCLLGTTQNEMIYDGTLGPHSKTKTDVKCVVNFFGPTDFVKMDSQGSVMNHDAPDSPEGRLLGGKVSEITEKAKQASPGYQVSKNDAPILTVHGTKDRLVPYVQGKAFDEALDKAGVSSVLLTVEGGGHGNGFGPSVTEAVKTFLQRQLSGKEGKGKDRTVKAGL
ncbi:alpha/beta hydrolase [bacterium]|nr:alpha/beta hydrolase [bacterium]